MEAPLRDLVRFVRAESPYYAGLYENVNVEPTLLKLEDLPVLDQHSYWEANGMADGNRVRTSPLVDGILFQSGGTTGKPKYVALTQSELQRTAMQLGSGLVAAGLQPGDRVANMFYAGELWGSFLLHVLSVMTNPVPAVQVPIGGLLDPSVNERLLIECGVTAILSTVTSLVRLAHHMLPQGRKLSQVHAVMFGGEALYPDQQGLLNDLFPNATFRGCVFGSMDAGTIGEAADSRQGNNDSRVYKVFDSTGILEICNDEEGREVIEKNGKEGILVYTSLIRRLTPVIRYATGDRGEWVDRAAGLFRVLGRSGLGIRLGPVSLEMSELRRLVRQAIQPASLTHVQAELSRVHGGDSLLIRVVAQVEEKAEATEQITTVLEEARPMLKQHLDSGLVESVKIEFVGLEALHVSPRSGKMMEVVDRRFD